MIKKAIILLLFISFQRTSFSQNSIPASKLHFNSKEQHRVPIDSLYKYMCSAVDSSGKTFTYSVKVLPSWLHYNPGTHSISGKPARPGQYPVHIVAMNPDTVVHQRFMLTVYNKQTTNILCLGNSITNGTNKYNSYRRALWRLLHRNNYNIDMVGSWSSHHMGGEVPNADFDMDHEGHSGWKASDVLTPPDWDKEKGNIHQWLQTYVPDIVLIEFGTNEVFQCIAAVDAVKNISAIIDSLRMNNVRVKVFLAQIPPLGDQWATKKLCGNDTAYAKRVIELNTLIKKFGNTKSTLISPVIIVDQYTGLNPKKHMYDDIHPNDSGEKIMAEKWFAAIRRYLKKL